LEDLVGPLDLVGDPGPCYDRFTIRMGHMEMQRKGPLGVGWGPVPTLGL
jgi:hypothetical protein